MKIIFAPTVALAILFLSTGILAQSPKTRSVKVGKVTKELNTEEFRSPFRYVIVAGVSEVEKYAADSLPESLTIHVLMESRAFNKNNLIKLFGLLGERFKEKIPLCVWVFTTLDALRTPEEFDRQDLSGPVENYRKYKWAAYCRSGLGEYFRYGIPGRFRERYVTIKEAPK